MDKNLSHFRCVGFTLVVLFVLLINLNFAEQTVYDKIDLLDKKTKIENIDSVTYKLKNNKMELYQILNISNSNDKKKEKTKDLTIINNLDWFVQYNQSGNWVNLTIDGNQIFYSYNNYTNGVVSTYNINFTDSSKFIIDNILYDDSPLKYNLTLMSGRDGQYRLIYQINNISDTFSKPTPTSIVFESIINTSAYLKYSNLTYDFSDVPSNLTIEEIIDSTSKTYQNIIYLENLSKDEIIHIDPTVYTTGVVGYAASPLKTSLARDKLGRYWAVIATPYGATGGNFANLSYSTNNGDSWTYIDGSKIVGAIASDTDGNLVTPTLSVDNSSNVHIIAYTNFTEYYTMYNLANDTFYSTCNANKNVSVFGYGDYLYGYKIVTNSSGIPIAFGSPAPTTTGNVAVMALNKTSCQFQNIVNISYVWDSGTSVQPDYYIDNSDNLHIFFINYTGSQFNLMYAFANHSTQSASYILTYQTIASDIGKMELGSAGSYDDLKSFVTINNKNNLYVNITIYMKYAGAWSNISTFETNGGFQTAIQHWMSMVIDRSNALHLTYATSGSGTYTVWTTNSTNGTTWTAPIRLSSILSGAPSVLMGRYDYLYNISYFPLLYSNGTSSPYTYYFNTTIPMINTTDPESFTPTYSNPIQKNNATTGVGPSFYRTITGTGSGTCNTSSHPDATWSQVYNSTFAAISHTDGGNTTSWTCDLSTGTYYLNWTGPTISLSESTIAQNASATSTLQTAQANWTVTIKNTGLMAVENISWTATACPAWASCTARTGTLASAAGSNVSNNYYVRATGDAITETKYNYTQNTSLTSTPTAQYVNGSAKFTDTAALSWTGVTYAATDLPNCPNTFSCNSSSGTVAISASSSTTIISRGTGDNVNVTKYNYSQNSSLTSTTAAQYVNASSLFTNGIETQLIINFTSADFSNCPYSYSCNTTGGVTVASISTALGYSRGTGDQINSTRENYTQNGTLTSTTATQYSIANSTLTDNASIAWTGITFSASDFGNCPSGHSCNATGTGNIAAAGTLVIFSRGVGDALSTATFNYSQNASLTSSVTTQYTNATSVVTEGSGTAWANIAFSSTDFANCPSASVCNATGTIATLAASGTSTLYSRGVGNSITSTKQNYSQNTSLTSTTDAQYVNGTSSFSDNNSITWISLAYVATDLPNCPATFVCNSSTGTVSVSAGGSTTIISRGTGDALTPTKFNYTQNTTLTSTSDTQFVNASTNIANGIAVAFTGVTFAATDMANCPEGFTCNATGTMGLIDPSQSAAPIFTRGSGDSLGTTKYNYSQNTSLTSTTAAVYVNASSLITNNASVAYTSVTFASTEFANCPVGLSCNQTATQNVGASTTAIIYSAGVGDAITTTKFNYSQNGSLTSSTATQYVNGTSSLSNAIAIALNPVTYTSDDFANCPTGHVCNATTATTSIGSETSTLVYDRGAGDGITTTTYNYSQNGSLTSTTDTQYVNATSNIVDSMSIAWTGVTYSSSDFSNCPLSYSCNQSGTVDIAAGSNTLVYSRGTGDLITTTKFNYSQNTSLTSTTSNQYVNATSSLADGATIAWTGVSFTSADFANCPLNFACNQTGTADIASGSSTSVMSRGTGDAVDITTYNYTQNNSLTSTTTSVFVNASTSVTNNLSIAYTSFSLTASDFANCPMGLSCNTTQTQTLPASDSILIVSAGAGDSLTTTKFNYSQNTSLTSTVTAQYINATSSVANAIEVDLVGVSITSSDFANCPLNLTCNTTQLINIDSLATVYPTSAGYGDNVSELKYNYSQNLSAPTLVNATTLLTNDIAIEFVLFQLDTNAFWSPCPDGYVCNTSATVTLPASSTLFVYSAGSTTSVTTTLYNYTQNTSLSSSTATQYINASTNVTNPGAAQNVTPDATMFANYPIGFLCNYSGTIEIPAGESAIVYSMCYGDAITTTTKINYTQNTSLTSNTTIQFVNASSLLTNLAAINWTSLAYSSSDFSNCPIAFICNTTDTVALGESSTVYAYVRGRGDQVTAARYNYTQNTSLTSNSSVQFVNTSTVFTNVINVTYTNFEWSNIIDIANCPTIYTCNATGTTTLTNATTTKVIVRGSGDDITITKYNYSQNTTLTSGLTAQYVNATSATVNAANVAFTNFAYSWFDFSNCPVGFSCNATGTMTVNNAATDLFRARGTGDMIGLSSAYGWSQNTSVTSNSTIQFVNASTALSNGDVAWTGISLTSASFAACPTNFTCNTSLTSGAIAASGTTVVAARGSGDAVTPTTYAFSQNTSLVSSPTTQYINSTSRFLNNLAISLTNFAYSAFDFATCPTGYVCNTTGTATIGASATTAIPVRGAGDAITNTTYNYSQNNSLVSTPDVQYVNATTTFTDTANIAWAALAFTATDFANCPIYFTCNASLTDSLSAMGNTITSVRGYGDGIDLTYINYTQNTSLVSNSTTQFANASTLLTNNLTIPFSNVNLSTSNMASCPNGFICNTTAATVAGSGTSYALSAATSEGGVSPISISSKYNYTQNLSANTTLTAAFVNSTINYTNNASFALSVATATYDLPNCPSGFSCNLSGSVSVPASSNTLAYFRGTGAPFTLTKLPYEQNTTLQSSVLIFYVNATTQVTETMNQNNWTDVYYNASSHFDVCPQNMTCSFTGTVDITNGSTSFIQRGFGQDMVAESNSTIYPTTMNRQFQGYYIALTNTSIWLNSSLSANLTTNITATNLSWNWTDPLDSNAEADFSTSFTSHENQTIAINYSLPLTIVSADHGNLIDFMYQNDTSVKINATYARPIYNISFSHYAPHNLNALYKCQNLTCTYTSLTNWNLTTYTFANDTYYIDAGDHLSSIEYLFSVEDGATGGSGGGGAAPPTTEETTPDEDVPPEELPEEITQELDPPLPETCTAGATITRTCAFNGEIVSCICLGETGWGCQDCLEVAILSNATSSELTTSAMGGSGAALQITTTPIGDAIEQATGGFIQQEAFSCQQILPLKITIPFTEFSIDTGWINVQHCTIMSVMQMKVDGKIPLFLFLILILIAITTYYAINYKKDLKTKSPINNRTLLAFWSTITCIAILYNLTSMIIFASGILGG